MRRNGGAAVEAQVESLKQNHYQRAAKSAVNDAQGRGRYGSRLLFSRRPKMGMIFDSPRSGELGRRATSCLFVKPLVRPGGLTRADRVSFHRNGAWHVSYACVSDNRPDVTRERVPRGNVATVAARPCGEFDRPPRGETGTRSREREIGGKRKEKGRGQESPAT